MTEVVSTLENALEYQAIAESSMVVDIIPRIGEGSDKTEIVDSSDLRALRLPDSMAASKVMQLIYTNYGSGLLALASNGLHKLWTRKQESTATIVPELWQTTDGAVMSNDLNESKPPEESAACMVLSDNEKYLWFASGGKVPLFNMKSYKVIKTFLPPPPAATHLALYPEDYNIIAIGKGDSTIDVYNISLDEVRIRLEGHQKEITGLEFSDALQLLVSSGADAQICLWDINEWVKLKSRSLQSPPGYPSSLVGDTKIQCHKYLLHLLVVHESQIAIFDPELECLEMWFPRETLSAPISSATYSCDGLLIFTGFSDSAVGVFSAQNLRLCCRISPSAYIPSSISRCNSTAYPRVIAAHPSDPNQFALGMSDGLVHVIEPADGDPKWGGSTHSLLRSELQKTVEMMKQKIRT